MKSLLQIIKEEISNFNSDWQTSNEPSIADDYYSNRVAVSQIKPQSQIGGELIGYVNTVGGQPAKTPNPLYKNPDNLNGFASNTRGILLANGDVFIAQSAISVHDDILKTLYEKGLVPRGASFNYFDNYPEEFVAIQRAGSSNVFGQSMAYDEFPIYYQEIFDVANKNHQYKFNVIRMDEQLDTNNLMSYFPDGYDAGIVN